MPMADGRVEIEGCDATFRIRRPEDAFHRAFYHAEYDITELSFSQFMARYSEDNVAYDVIPVFPSRAFRHGALFVRTDRGIETPEDLKGKTLGLMDFEMTAALVARGMLTDDHNIAPRDISWVVGAVEPTTLLVALEFHFPPSWASTVDKTEILRPVCIRANGTAFPVEISIKDVLYDQLGDGEEHCIRITAVRNIADYGQGY
jgi:hypothetical protein